MSASGTEKRLKPWDWGLAVLLLWGVFAPSSLAGKPSPETVLVSLILLALLYAWVIVRYGLSGRFAVACGVVVIGAPLAFTGLVEGSRIAWGKSMFFVMLAMMYLPSLREIGVTKLTRWIFLAASAAVLAVAAAMIVVPDLVKAPLLGYYNAYYEELMPNMLRNAKPVGTFASHNVAALFYFFFFYLHLRSYMVTRRAVKVVGALAFLLTIALLKSNTALLFSGLAFAALITLLLRSKGGPPKLYAGLILLLVCVVAAAFSEKISEVIQKILSSDTNGLAGRFSRTGNLRGTLDYLLANPFEPVGFQYRGEIFYGDCGYLEMLIRGSAPLLLAAYGGLYLFMRNNVVSKLDKWVLLGVIGLMEVGFSTMISMRTQFLLPFVVVYLNGLEREGRRMGR